MMNKMMNLRRGAVALIGALALTATACGSDKTSMDVEYNVDDYVTLGDYEALPVTISGDYSAEYAFNVLAGSGNYVPDETKTVVEADSIVNVDYEGIKDGVAFDGGSAQDVTLDVANNSNAGSSTGYIDGFTAGLVGAEVGTTIDCDVTFPENYGATDLAGQEVIFRFTINYIATPMSLSSLTDEYVAENFGASGYTTVDDIRAAAEEYAESLRTQDIRTAVIEAMEQNSQVTIPEELLESRLEEYMVRYTNTYVTDGSTLEEFLQQYDETMTEESFREDVKEMLNQNLVDELIFEAVAKAENIEFDQEDYDSYIQRMMENNGISTEEELFENFGSDAESGEAYLKKMYVANKACDYIVENAVVSEM